MADFGHERFLLLLFLGASSSSTGVSGADGGSGGGGELPRLDDECIKNVIDSCKYDKKRTNLFVPVLITCVNVALHVQCPQDN